MSFEAPESAGQVQIGTSIGGQTFGDIFGYTVSMPDPYTFAAGAPLNENIDIAAGQVRIYRWNGTAWIKKGADIYGSVSGEGAGRGLSMPDSNTVAVGAIGLSSGYGGVKIYNWSGSAWTQKGNTIFGENANDQAGEAVSMPDKNTVAIGARQNDGNGTASGHVRIFRWNGSAWIQKGADIDGSAAEDQSGWSVSMPDSNTVAIGAPNNDGNGLSSGQVRIFRWNGSAWIQKGANIYGFAALVSYGYDVSMPDSNTVAITEEKFVNSTGQVHVYKWNGSAWVQKGANLGGVGDGNFLAGSIDMPDSNTIAIGGGGNSDNGTGAGQVRVYGWTGSAWVLKGGKINGKSAYEKFGSSVSMPNNNMVVSGGTQDYSGSYGNGLVRVYVPCVVNTVSLTISRCEKYTSPSGKYTWTSSGTYKDTIVSPFGCDSFLTINLTIKKGSSSNVTISACNKYVSPSGRFTWYNSGTYHDTIPGAAGCDSSITFNLTIKKTTSATISANACGSFRSPSGKYTWTMNGTYKDTLTNVAGCDSILTINLTIRNSSAGNTQPSVCRTYTAPSGKYTWSASGIYHDTLKNAVGCDSIITINLTVLNTNTSINPLTCSSYTSPSGKYIWTVSGTYHDTLVNVANCDSIITVNLTIPTIDVTVTNNSPALVANAVGATYQWLNCITGFSPVAGATAKTFIPASNGSYAVKVTQNSCMDTSVCYTVNNVGIAGSGFDDALHIMPNPTQGRVFVHLGNTYERVEAIVRNPLGIETKHFVFESSSRIVIDIPGNAGIYYLELTAGDRVLVHTRIIKY